MEALPKEILMIILKQSYAHPYEILTSLSLVCKRWKHLCEDKYCWSKAELELSDREPLEILQKNAIVFIKAPQLYTLSIACNKLVTGDDIQKVLIRSFELQSEGNLKLRVLSVKLNNQDMLQPLGLFITKNAFETLEIFNIRIMPRHWTSFPQIYCHVKDVDVPFFEMIYHFRRLKTLLIHVNGNIHFGSLQEKNCPALEELTFYVVGQTSNPSAEGFANKLLTGASPSLKSIDLHLSCSPGYFVPNVIMPSLCRLKFGFLDDPLQLETENFPNLHSISFNWLMFPTPRITEILDRMLHHFQRFFVNCVVTICCVHGETFDEQRFTDLIAINHKQQRYNVTFKVLNC